MIKSILSLLLLSCSIVVMFLSTATTAMAQTTDDVRIYINPGHGSWGPDNRHMETIGHSPISTTNPDTTDFFESNTNLHKCLAVLEKLIDYGVPFDRTKNQTNSNANRIGAALDLTQNLVMSRVKNGPYPYSSSNSKTDKDNDFNRTLSVIAAEVEANDFDMFISIHSNAYNEGSTTNYLYFAMDGYASSSSTKITKSKEMSRCGWNHRILDRHTQWSSYNYTLTAAELAAGKGKIGQQNLGVLNHSVPGYLVEGYFHTYQPARHRAMNPDVCRLEGVDYARGVADYFGWEKENTGDIYGIVWDKSRSVSNSLYTYKSGTNDAYFPMNGTTVELYNQENELLHTYTVDNNYNGAFVFYKLAPGTYKLISRADGFSDLLQEVTVTAAATTYTTMFPVAGSEVIELVETTPNYPDIAPQDEEVSLQDSYEFTTKIESVQIAELSGKTIRRAIMRDGLFYVLALNADNTPNIYVIDPETQSVKSTLSTTGVVMTSNGGGTGVDGYNYSLQLPLSDIAFTADGYLLACNYTINQDDAKATSGIDRGYYRVYKWEKGTDNIPTGNPTELISTTQNGWWNYGKVGSSFTVSGALDNCEILTGAITYGSSGQIRFLHIIGKNGVYEVRNLWRPTSSSGATSTITVNPLNATTVSANYQLNVSPTNRSEYIIDGLGSGCVPYLITPEYDSTSSTDYTFDLSSTMSNDKNPAASYFKFSGNSIMATPEINATGVACGVKWYNLSSSFETPTEISTGAEITASGDATTYATTGVNVKRNYMYMYLLADDKISKFAYKLYTGTSPRAQYAYNLDMSISDHEYYTFSFDVTGYAPDAYIVLTNTENEDDIIEYYIGEVQEGHNEVTINTYNEVKDGTFHWAVKIDSDPVKACERYFTSTRTLTANTRGGVAFVKDTESDAFGKIVVSNGFSQGIDVYSPKQELESTTPYSGNTGNAASTYRIAEHEGIVYVTDWSDGYSGIYTFNPASPATLKQWYNGTRGSGGIFTNSAGTIIGGGTPGLDIYGKGNDAKMYVFCEDYPKANGQTLVQYNFGGALTWDKAPNKTFTNATAKLNQNTNVEILATENGLFCTQVRSKGNTSEDLPGLIYVDYNDNILYNSGETFNSSAGSIAINDDLSLLAFATQEEGIIIHSVSWNNNVPTLTKQYVIPNSVASVGVNSSYECNQLDFDVAGNLHAYLRGDGYCMFVLPNDNPTATTSAKMEQIVVGGTLTEVDNIVTDDNAPIEYYNLQGVKVARPTNGIFIKKQGSKTTKVVL